MKQLILGGNFKVSIPESWNEITFEQFYKLEIWRKTKEQNLIKALAIITDMPYEMWNKSNYGDFKSLVLPVMQWLNNPVLLRRVRMKRSIEIMDKTIEIPLNAEIETLGQKVAIDRQFAEYIGKYKDHTKVAFWQMSYAIAVYCSPKITGKDFDMDHVIQVQKEIQQMSALDMIPIGTFFLKRLDDSTRWSVLYPLRNSIRMRLQQIWNRLKSLVSLKRGMRSQEATLLSTTKY